MGTDEVYRLLTSLNLLYVKLKKYKDILSLQESAICKYEVSHVAYYTTLERQTAKELTGLYKVVTSLQTKSNLINVGSDEKIVNVCRSIDSLLPSVKKNNLRNQKLIGHLLKKVEKDLLSFRQNQAKCLFALSQSSSPIYDLKV